MNKLRKIHLKHLFEELDGMENSTKMMHQPLYIEREAWIRFKICCHFQAIEPLDALRNYIKSASPAQIVEHARKQIGGKN